MLSLCSHYRAEHNFIGPGKRRMQANGFSHLPNPLAAEPTAGSQPADLYQNKQKTSTQTPSQMQKMAGGREHLHQSLAQQVNRQHSLHGKKGNENMWI